MKEFKDLLILETKARDIYLEILDMKPGKNISEPISLIKEQEIGHMKLVEYLISFAKEADKRKSRPKISKKTLDYLKSDLSFKRHLLDTVDRFVDFRIEVIKLIDLFKKQGLKTKSLDKARKNLFDTLIHQLKSPLVATKWISDQLLQSKENGLKQSHKERIKKIQEANKAMVFLVDDLLESSRVENGISCLFEEIDIIETINSIKDMVRELAESKNLNIKFQAENEQLIVNTCKDAVEKIISIFLNNAIQYSREKDEIKIIVSKQTDKEILISVHDNGIGIPGEEQERIFKKFFRASNAKIWHQQGTGLGLYIAKLLAKKIKAKIWFESWEGKGTKFFLLI